jgi:hypothetical protein
MGECGMSVGASSIERMIEIDAMGVPRDLRELDAESLLDLAHGSVQERRRGPRGQLRLALHWGRLHPAGPGDEAVWGDFDREGSDIPILSEGCPGVQAGCIATLGAALDLGTTSAAILISDAFELAFRLPRVWAAVEALDTDVFKPRRVARLTHDLCPEAAAFVDEQLGDQIGRMSMRSIEEIIARAINQFHPERADERARKGKAGWHVEVHHPDYVDFAGTSHLSASADSLDLMDHHAALTEIAEELRLDGDTDPLGQRLAKALGILGRLATGRAEHPSADQLPDPEEDLLPDEAAPVPDDGRTGTCPDDGATVPADGAPGAPADHPARGGGAPGGAPGGLRPGGLLARTRSNASGVRGNAARTRSRRPIVVHAHLSDRAVTGLGPAAGTALYEVPGFGVVGEEAFQHWTGTHRVRASQVIDLGREDAVDQHDPPDWMRTQVKERDRHCLFPHCAVDAERCDIDHIDAYVEDGPPGQTRPGNLACLCRRHHLLKTFGGWTYVRARDGTFVWRSPMGTIYLVNRDGLTYQTGQAA